MRDSIDIGKVVKRTRERMNLKQNEFAEKLGIHKSTLSKYESGKRKIPLEDIGKMADVLNISPEELLLETHSIIPISSAPVPVLSHVSAGEPLYAEENIVEYAQIPSSLYKEGADQFYLKISGDSMDKEFKEGDLVLVEKDSFIENGQIGVVMINGYNATVKRVRYDQDKIILYPESNNPEHLPQIYHNGDDVTLVGKVISSQKFY